MGRLESLRMFGWLRPKKESPEKGGQSEVRAPTGYMHPAGICLNTSNGKVLQGYRLLDEISGLRYQSTFRARHEKDGRPARVEFRWHGGNKEAGEFNQESRRLASFQHPAASRLYAWGETSGDYRLFYRICEEVDGQDLREWQPPNWQEGLRMFREFVDVLAAAHAHDLLHGNLQRGSLWRTPGGGLKLASFGKTMGPEFYSCDADPEDFAFMSAEEIQGGRLTAAKEQYSAGLVGYYLLTGQSRYQESVESDILHQLSRVLSGGPFPLPREIRPDIPLEVEQVILRMMATEDPFPDLAAVGAALKNVRIDE